MRRVQCFGCTQRVWTHCEMCLSLLGERRGPPGVCNGPGFQVWPQLLCITAPCLLAVSMHTQHVTRDNPRVQCKALAFTEGIVPPSFSALGSQTRLHASRRRKACRSVGGMVFVPSSCHPQSVCMDRCLGCQA
jgi:hypothetical protein